MSVLLEETETAQSHLRTEHLETDLRSRTVEGGALTLAAQALKLALRTLSLVVLARLVEPDDFGLVAMVAVITSLLALLQDLGLPAATIQRRAPTQAQVSTLFWLNVGLSLALTILTLVLAPAVAALYGESRLAAIAAALAPVFVLGGLGAQHHALLARQMRYGRLAAIEIAALALSGLVGIGAALGGAGYWSLVLSQVVLALASTAGAWIACSWRPGPPRRDGALGSFVAFGAHLTGFQVANALARNADNLLIGRFVGAGALGLYSRAYKLILLPVEAITQPLTSVVVPALSRLQQDGPRFRSYYLKSLALIAGTGMPLVAWLFLAADDAVLVVLGPRWEGVASLFRLLAPAALVGTFNVAGSWSCTALGRTERLWRWQLVASAVLVASFVAGIPWGAAGVASAYSLATVVLRYPGLRYLLKGTPVRPRDVLVTVARPALAAVAAAAAVFLLSAAVGLELAPPLRLCLSLPLYVGLYALAWLASHAGTGTLRELARIVSELRRCPAVASRLPSDPVPRVEV